jgi:sigma-54-dependent transcriptional regulator
VYKRQASAGALPLSLAQSELFGHRRGSFTGADRDRKGLFLEARGSTLILDDIVDYSPALQAMLLNAVEYGMVRPVGCDTDEHSDARVVATSNRSLPAAVAGGTFREDLYYRLSGSEIRIPPLREHLADIPIYARDLLSSLARETSCGQKDLSDGALDVLQEHGWPGNVRELQNIVARAFYSTTQDTLRAEHILGAFEEGTAPPSPTRVESRDEETRIRCALRTSGGNVSRAARALGIGRTWMYRLQRKYGIGRE